MDESFLLLCDHDFQLEIRFAPPRPIAYFDYSDVNVDDDDDDDIYCDCDEVAVCKFSVCGVWFCDPPFRSIHSIVVSSQLIMAFQ